MEEQRLHALSSHIQHYSPMDYHRFPSTYSMRHYHHHHHPTSVFSNQVDCWFPTASYSAAPSSSKYDSTFDYHSNPYISYNQSTAADLDYKPDPSASTKATVAAYFNFNFNCDQAHNHHHHLFPENSSLETTSSQSISPNNFKQTINHKAQNLNDLSSTIRLSPKASSSGGL